jgi:hypothetical protein
LIAEIASRLDSEVSALKQIGGAAEFEAASTSSPNAVPAAFVIPLGEDPQPSEGGNFILQPVRVSVGVVWAVRNVADVKGAAAQGDLAPLRIAGGVALLGWSPTGAEPLERGPGRLLGIKNNVLYWQDVYRTNIYLRS